MSNYTLTTDQQNALTDLFAFVSLPDYPVHVLQGYSGTGKTFLIQEFLRDIQQAIDMGKITNPKWQIKDVYLTATTNKAADVLSDKCSLDVQTIHSLLGLTPEMNWQTKQPELILKGDTPKIINSLILIDEASNCNYELEQWIKDRTVNCKILFVGDPAQTIHHKAKYAPVFFRDYPDSKLTELVRQPGEADHPIKVLAMQLAKTVMTGVWTKFTPDGYHVQKVSRGLFNEMMEDDFTRTNWKSSDSRYLAWSNNRVISQNKTIAELRDGRSEFEVGDTAIVNNAITSRQGKFKTDQEITISTKTKKSWYGLQGTWFSATRGGRAFMFDDNKKALALAQQEADHGNFIVADDIIKNMLDLRHTYASTVNKAQGSTYDQTVYLDIDNIAKCTNANQIARMMYVGASRPRNHLIMTGDF